jgi:hypothetical protein
LRVSAVAPGGGGKHSRDRKNQPTRQAERFRFALIDVKLAIGGCTIQMLHSTSPIRLCHYAGRWHMHIDQLKHKSPGRPIMPATFAQG